MGEKIKIFLLFLAASFIGTGAAMMGWPSRVDPAKATAEFIDTTAQGVGIGYVCRDRRPDWTEEQCVADFRRAMNAGVAARREGERK